MINSMYGLKKILFFLCILVVFGTTSVIGRSNMFLIDTTKAKGTDTCDYKKYYNSYGKIKEEGCLKNGKKQGVWKEYLDNGEIIFEWTYLNGLKSGPYKHYDNGKIDAVGEYKNGCLHGLLKRYNEKGELVQEQWWKANFSSGVSTMMKEKNYDKNAKPDNTIEKIDGKSYIWRNGKKIPLIEK